MLRAVNQAGGKASGFLSTEVRTLRRVWPLLLIYPWAAPLLVFLGILNALVEWVGIALLVPLLGPTDSSARIGPLYGLIAGPFVRLPVGQRVLLSALSILGAIALKVILAYGYSLLCNWLKEGVIYRLRCRIFAQFMRLGPGYQPASPSSRLLDLSGAGAESAGCAVASFVWLLIDLCKVAVFTSMMLLLSWWLTLVIGLSMLLIAILSRRLTTRTEDVSVASRDAKAELQLRLFESTLGLATVHAFARESHEERRHNEAALRVRRTGHALLRLLILVDPISEGLSAAVLVVLVMFAVAGKMPLAPLVTFIFMLYRLQPQVKSLEQNRVALIGHSAGAAEVIAFLNPADKTYVRSGDRIFHELQREIVLDEVTFQYPTKSRPAVESISITIPRGQMTAIVGPSGSGKSTLVSLLCRFYDVTAGEIRVDGVPLHTFDSNSWRSQLAVVSQDPFLFDATIRDNICYGRLDASESEIVAAAERAHAHEFIQELPQGYETFVGERGLRLSGGQRQRIALARAFLTNAQLLILDEATNELDGLSESAVYESIRALRGERTVLAIAHRLSTVEDADQIVVLEKGSVVEQGRLQELIAQDGLFAQLFRSQRLATLQRVVRPQGR